MAESPTWLMNGHSAFVRGPLPPRSALSCSWYVSLFLRMIYTEGSGVSYHSISNPRGQ